MLRKLSLLFFLSVLNINLVLSVDTSALRHLTASLIGLSERAKHIPATVSPAPPAPPPPPPGPPAPSPAPSLLEQIGKGVKLKPVVEVKKSAETAVEKMEKDIKNDSTFNFLKPLTAEEESKVKTTITQEVNNLEQGHEEFTQVEDFENRKKKIEEEFKTLDGLMKKLKELKDNFFGNDTKKNDDVKELIRKISEYMNIDKLDKNSLSTKLSALPSNIVKGKTGPGGAYGLEQILKEQENIENILKKPLGQISFVNINDALFEFKKILNGLESVIELAEEKMKSKDALNHINTALENTKGTAKPVVLKVPSQNEEVQVFVLVEPLVKFYENLKKLYQEILKKHEELKGKVPEKTETYWRSVAQDKISEYALSDYSTESEYKYTLLFDNILKKISNPADLANLKKDRETVRNIRDNQLKEFAKVSYKFEHNPYIDEANKWRQEYLSKKDDISLSRTKIAYAQEVATENMLIPKIKEASTSLINAIKNSNLKPELKNKWEDKIPNILSKYKPNARKLKFFEGLPGDIVDAFEEIMKEVT